MKNYLHTFTKWIFCLLAVVAINDLNAQNVREGFCDYAIDASCGVAITNQTNKGAPNIIWDYPQCNTYSFAGPEKVYKFTTTSAGTIQVDLDIYEANIDLDILLLTSNCSTPTCVAQSITSNANSKTEQIIYTDAPAGTYYVVMDSEKDVGNYDLLITCNTSEGCNLEYEVTPNHVYCGASKGSIEVDIAWGKAPFTIAWDNADNTIWNTYKTTSKDYKIENLPTGVYNIKVTDAMDCVVMKNNVVLTSTGSSLAATFSSTPAPCGSNFGWIDINVTNSSPPYWVTVTGPRSGTVQVTNNTSVIKDMPPGAYEVTVEKGNCTKTGWVTVGSTDDLSFATEVTNASCGGNGSFWITIDGGSPTYTLEWWHEDGTSNWVQVTGRSFPLNDMKAGEYTIKITDKNGCSQTKKVTMGGGSLDFALESNAATCGTKGSVWVTITSGTKDYVVEWTGPTNGWKNTEKSSFAIDDLVAGEYEINIKDAKGCSNTKWITVENNGGALDFELEANSVTCGDKGAIWVTVKNGNPKYTVEWWGPNTSKWATTQLKSFQLKDLVAGDYTVKITDVTGCSNTKTVKINNAGGGLEFTLESLGESCGSLASLWIDIKNGTSKFGIDINGPGVNRWFEASSPEIQVTDLKAGFYTVEVTDANGCKGTKTITIEDKGGNLDVEIETTDASCGIEGSSWVTIKNGTPKFIIELWGPNNATFWAETSSSSFKLSELAAGDYTLKLTDKKGCSTTKNFKIGGSGSTMGMELEVNNAGCEDNGRIWVTINGGTPGYNLKWTGPSPGEANINNTGYQINNLKAGNYTLTVKDVYGCSYTKTVSVYATGDNLKLALESNNATCSQNGYLWANLENGEAPYKVSWTGAAAGAIEVSNKGFQISDLPAGEYWVTVKDKNGCSVTEEVSVNKTGDNVDYDLEVNNGSCGYNGYIWVTVQSGDGPYYISWTGPKNGEANSGSNGYQISNLPAGWYKVSVKDKHGCKTIKDVEMLGGSVYTVTTQQKNATCGKNGEVAIDMNGGVAPFKISLSGPVIGRTSTNGYNYFFPSVPPGTYTLTLEDATGCVVSKQLTITNSGGNLSASVEVTNAICDQGGGAWLTVSGNSAPYTIDWTGPVSGSYITSNSGYQLQNLPAGDYTISIKDNYGCYTNKSITINNTGNSLNLSLEATNASCGQKGAIWATISGGKTDYSIKWTGPSSGSVQTGNTGYQITDLVSGTYTVTVTDKNNCIITKSITIGSNVQSFSISTESTNATCGQKGWAYITMNGGSPNYNISWSGPSSGAISTSTTGYRLDNLVAGTYTVTVKDYSGCEDSKTIIIENEGSNIGVSLEATSAICNGKGAIWATISGGTGGFSYSWTGPVSGSVTTAQTDYKIENLPVGTYTVTVRDSKGCENEETITVQSVGGSLSINLSVGTTVACEHDGSTLVSINGGSAPYTISYSGVTSGSVVANSDNYELKNLLPGDYTINVTDSNGCLDSEKIKVYDNSSDLDISLTGTNASCSNKGMVQVDITGGISNYQINWSGNGLNGAITTGNNSFVLTDLPGGTYNVVVKDGIGCSVSRSIVIESTASNLGLTLTNTNASCGSNGNITATVSNGEGDYTYSWTGPVSGSEKVSTAAYTIWDLPAGSYTVSAIDKNGCSISSVIEINTANNELALNVVGKNAACGQPSSIQVTIANGVPNFKIEWSGANTGTFNTSANSYTITNVTNGETIVRVTDASGCSKEQAVVIDSNLNDVSFTYETRDATCNSKGSIWLTIADGNSPYNIAWTGPSTGASVSADEAVQITDLIAGVYSVTISDKGGCMITQTIEVKNGGGSVATNFAYKGGAVTCNKSGSLLITMISGVAPYTVTWSGPTNGSRTATSEDIKLEDLAAGSYQVTVASANGCGTLTQAIEIEDKRTVLGINGTVTNGVCGGKGMVELSWTGDRDPYTISWTGESIGSTITNAKSQTITDLKDGSYTFMVTGYDGCTGQYEATINNSGTSIVADFTYAISGKKLVFSNLSSTGTYAWDFGDGKTSTETNPTYTYDNNGTYTICLTVTNDCGTKEKCQSVTINAVTSDGSSAKIVLTEKSGAKGAVLQLPVRVENCTRIGTLSGTIKLGNDQVAKINGLSPNAISPIYNDANHSFSYLAGGSGMNITSETILFYVNVQLTGKVGESSTVDLSSLPVALELTCTENGYTPPITPEVGSGRVSISTSAAVLGEVGGHIQTYWGDGVADAIVTIRSTDHEMSPMTSLDGDYTVADIPMGYQYEFMPSKTTNPANGLSTFGLFLTQKFILGYHPDQIQSPYQVIAMDANCSGTLTTFDIFVMQQMLVGNLTEFPDCDSWTFVDANHEFPTEFTNKNVFPYPNSHTMMLESDKGIADFIGVKIGDVLGRALPIDNVLTAPATDRNRQIVPLQVSATEAAAGEIVEVHFQAQDFTEMVSFQLGLDYDQGALELIEFAGNAENELTSTLAGINRNQLKISWYDPAGKGTALVANEDLFAIKFVAKQKITNILELFTINNRTFVSELHQNSNNAYRFKLVNKSPTNSTFKVHQNTPNPFKDATTITIEMPSALDAAIVLHDQFGRTIQTIQQPLTKGLNRVNINRNQLSAGVYYYTVKAGDFAATKRMLIIE